MPQSSRPSGQSGFSLIELIVAMAVTLVVTGAVYGLMSGGNNAFRREPELTERQQNVRVAMDLIQKDISTAGVNMGPFFQTFSRNLNAVGRITGPAGQVADHLEIFGNDGTCPEVTSASPALNGGNLNAIGRLPDCYSEDAIVLVTYENGGAKWGVGHNIHKDATKINFPPGQADGAQIDSIEKLRCYNKDANKGDPDCAPPNGLSPVNILRYEIAPDPLDGVPSLFRSPTGGRDPAADGNYLPPTTPANITAGRWQLVARGIEDLQVQYKTGSGVWADDPGDVICAGSCMAPTEADFNKGVREVRVTISGRAEGQNLAGQSTSLAAGAGSRANAVRGSATAVMTVKALQVYLAAVGPTSNGGSCPTCPVWR